MLTLNYELFRTHLTWPFSWYVLPYPCGGGEYVQPQPKGVGCTYSLQLQVEVSTYHLIVHLKSTRLPTSPGCLTALPQKSVRVVLATLFGALYTIEVRA